MSFPYLTFVSAIALSFGFLTQAHADEPTNRIWFYRVEIREALLANFEMHTDTFATVLQASAEKDGCIDVQSLGSYSEGNGRVQMLHHGTVGVLIKQPISPETADKVRAAICTGAGRDCSVTVTSTIYPLGELYLETWLHDNRGEPGGCCHTYHPDDHINYPLGVNGTLPRVSESCLTGTTAGFTNTFSSEEARNYLNRLGVNFSSVRTLHLNRRVPGETEFTSLYTFGFFNPR